MSSYQHRTERTLNLMPVPRSAELTDKTLAVTDGFPVVLSSDGDNRIEAAVERFARRIAPRVKIDVRRADNDTSTSGLQIRCTGGDTGVQALGDEESYSLTIDETRAVLAAPEPLGVLRGLETVLQFMTPDGTGFTLPVGHIEDSPRFPWRGLMIDVSREWIDAAQIKRNIDAMAAVKLNVFHWHLSDDQGFRIECKSFPRLHEFGSDGNFYTQDEVAEVVEYARLRGIRVVPEFDIPGHATAWFVGHPEIATLPGPYTIERRWGIFDPAMDPTREETYQFLETFLKEITSLFPDAYFHIGGDEVWHKQWDETPHVQAYMKEHEIADSHDLQAHFNLRVHDILTRCGKKMDGWDEIVNPGMPADVLIQSWRGREALADASSKGYDTILSNGYYLGGESARYYANDPIAGVTAGLPKEQTAHILGGEACMWTERSTAENVDSHIWPFAAAVAERLWSPASVTDEFDMYRRLNIVSDRLEELGLQHRSGLRRALVRLAGTDDIAALESVASALGSARPSPPDGAQYVDADSLDRLLDAVSPESDAVRDFKLFAQSPAENTSSLRSMLQAWEENSAAAIPLFETRPFLKEHIPTVRTLADVARIGFLALDYLASGSAAPEAWATEQIAWLEVAGKPNVGVYIAIARPIQQIVRLTGGIPEPTAKEE